MLDQAARFISQRLGGGKVVDAGTDPTVYKFTVVRHPADRARSAFGNLFVGSSNGFGWRHLPYLRRTGLKLGDDSTANFDRFDYVEDAQADSELFCDAHLRLQMHNTGVVISPTIV